MRALAALVVVTAAGLWAQQARADDIAFAEASSELDDGKPATSLWNAVDGKDTTSWCAKPDDSAPVLSFGFDQPVTVTHLTLIVGGLKGTDPDRGLDKTKKRARIVYVVDAEHRVEAQFKDDPGPQTLELSPPAKGRRIVVEFPGFYDGDKPNASLCIAEVTLKNKGTELTGAAVATKLRALNTPSKRLLHEWLDDVSAPTRTLLFNVDGTFTYRFEPLLEGKPAKAHGKWSTAGSALLLTVGDKNFRLDSRLTKVDNGADGATVELTLSGDAPTPSMAASYHPAPAKLP
ncbi:MAG TPA: discoidin domain-containing protein [Myxococcota bacterium]|jgi:hypothetical protein